MKIIKKILERYSSFVAWDRHTSPNPENFKWLFDSSPEFDSEILADYGEWIDKVSADQLEHWKQTTDGRLAYMTLCDQFTRNAYRNQAKAFSLDEKVRTYVKSLFS